MKQLSIFLISLLCTLPSFGAEIAVVDSGTYFDHEVFAGKMFVNPAETANYLDDDNNGKIDDISGWNFVDGYHQTFFTEHMNQYPKELSVILEIAAKIELDRLTEKDKAYWNKIVEEASDQQKAELMAIVNNYGQYAHGTHTAGIVAMEAPTSSILALRTIADLPPIPTDFFDEFDPSRNFILKALYGALSSALNANFLSIADYLKEMQQDVANFSLGTPLTQIAKTVLSVKGISEPTDDELASEIEDIYAELEPKGIEWIEHADQTLIVLASGNEALDIDKFKAYPASIDVDNSITVGSSNGTASISMFSNYGMKSVHVLAPGSAIVSAVPNADNKTMMPFSGTSMAAPYVSGMAGNIHDANPSLTPKQIKEIIIGTVDVKDWLADKVISSGIVNAQRAYAAAALSKTMPIKEAIMESKLSVADQAEKPASFGLPTEQRLDSPSFIKTPEHFKVTAAQFRF